LKKPILALVPEEGEAFDGIDDPQLDEALPEFELTKLRDDIEMAKGLCPEFDIDAYLAGNLSPVFFGSAINSFGVRELLKGLAEIAPPPRPQSCRRTAGLQPRRQSSPACGLGPCHLLLPAGVGE